MLQGHFINSCIYEKLLMLSDPPQESRRKSQFPVNDPLLEKVNWRRDGGPKAFALGISLLVNFLAYQQLQHVDISFAAASSGNWEREVEYAIEEPPAPEESRYVETNPDVPTNIPDETENFASRDQQAAQEEPSPLGPDRTPFLEGEEEDSPKIVDGEMPSEPIPFSVVTGLNTPARPDLTAAMPLPTPPPSAPDFIEQAPVSDEGIGSYLEPGVNVEPVDASSDNRVIELTLNPLVTGEDPERQARDDTNLQPVPESGPQVPMERPQFQGVLPGPVMKSRGSVPGFDIRAIDAKFNEFGEYLDRIYEIIGTQWLLLASQVRRGSVQSASRVIVDFVLTSDGTIRTIEIAYSSAGQASTLICKDAIQSRAPFNNWTDDMIGNLGEEQPIRVTFIYR